MNGDSVLKTSRPTREERKQQGDNENDDGGGDDVATDDVGVYVGRGV